MDHAQIVISAILPNHLDNLQYALAHLTKDHFASPTQKVIFASLEFYFEKYGTVITKPILSDYLLREGIDPAKVLLVEEVFQSASGTPVSDHEFKYSLTALQDAMEKQKMGEAITTAYDILEKGAMVDKEELKGPKDARQFLYDEMGRIDKVAGVEQAPAGDMRLEINEFHATYLEAKNGDLHTINGVHMGIPTIDKATGGLVNGDLALMAAFTNTGKSQFCVQAAWSAAIEQGKNVFYSTSETVRSTINRRIVARHSKHPKFDFPQGLDSTALKQGTLTVIEEKVLMEVLDDLRTNPEYGKIYVAQIPRGATLSYIEARMRRQQQAWNIDLAIVDYLNLIKPDTKRVSQREEANDILKDSKTFATSFADGKGVPLLSPWQMSRNAYQLALQTGFYELGSLADTSEAEKSADFIGSLLRFPDSPKKVKFQVLKLRDAEIPSILELDIDYRCSYFAEQKAGDLMLNASWM